MTKNALKKYSSSSSQTLKRSEEFELDLIELNDQVCELVDQNAPICKRVAFMNQELLKIMRKYQQVN